MEKSQLASLLLSEGPRLRQFIDRRIPPRYRALFTADDIFQEACETALRTCPDFIAEDPRALNRWLITIAKSRLVDALRYAYAEKRARIEEKWAQDSAARLVGLLAHPAPSGVIPRNAAVSDEAREAVRVALASLPEHGRAVLGLYYLEGRSRVEIAELMASTVPAIKGILARGRRQMRRLLGSASRYFSGAHVPQGREQQE